MVCALYCVGKAVPITSDVPTPAAKTCSPSIMIEPGRLCVYQGVIKPIEYFIGLIFLHYFKEYFIAVFAVVHFQDWVRLQDFLQDIAHILLVVNPIGTEAFEDDVGRVPG